MGWNSHSRSDGFAAFVARFEDVQTLEGNKNEIINVFSQASIYFRFVFEIKCYLIVDTLVFHYSLTDMCRRSTPIEIMWGVVFMCDRTKSNGHYGKKYHGTGKRLWYEGGLSLLLRAHMVADRGESSFLPFCLFFLV